MSLTNTGSMNIYVAGSAFKFYDVGSPNYVSFTESKYLLGTPFSLVVNAKITSVPAVWAYDYIIGRDSTYYLIIRLAAQGSKMEFDVYGKNGIGPSSVSIGSSRYSINKWHHFACTYDSTSMDFYVDGILISSNTKPPSVMSSNAVKSLRFSYPSPGYGFNGLMTEVRIYSGNKLNSTEVKQLYNGINIKDGLVGHWKFDEREGSKIYDSTGYGATGANIGTTKWIDKDIQCWCNRWDEGNWDVTVETMMDAHDRNYLFSKIRPGAVKELYNILGTPYYRDITWKSGNTLILEPLGGYGLSGVSQRRIVAVKNASDDFLNKETYHVKLECFRLDV